ncbi:hypothetical protein XHC_3887 [Xanthomonas hortorum pv. carotae str. M081]|nr:hypothetical protein XHC_3887 [Xanthomonas hortorum pv. carotae str. M081]
MWPHLPVFAHADTEKPGVSQALKVYAINLSCRTIRG